MLSRSMITSTEVFPSAVVKYICRSPWRVLNRWSPRNPCSAKNAITSRFFEEMQAKSMSWSSRARWGKSGHRSRTAWPPRSLSGIPRAFASRTTPTETSNGSAEAGVGPSMGQHASAVPARARHGRSGGNCPSMERAFDYVIVGGGSAGSVLANRLTTDPANRVLVLEAGSSRLPLGRLHPHARGAHLPDRLELVRLEVRVRARTAHGRTPHLPRARQGPRRIEQHQRDDLPARQPAGLRAVGRRPRHGDMGLRPLPPLLQAHGDAASRRSPPTSTEGHSGPLVLERGPAKSPLFGAFFEAVAAGRVPAHRRRERVPPGGLRAVRPEHPPRASAVGRPRVPAPGRRAVRTSTCVPMRSSTRSCSKEPEPSASSTCEGRGPAREVRAGEVILCGGAINSPQTLQLSGVGDADELRALGVDVVQDVPGVGEHLQDHLEVYVQHSCTQPVSVPRD